MKPHFHAVAARSGTFTGIGHIRRSAVILASAVMIACALLFGVASGASAHDELSSSSPEPGATVETVPEAIELTFTNVPATIGSDIQVIDASGEDWAEGDVSITDAVATQAIREGAPAGAYTVNWRVVSADSHPIEGTFEFTATSGAAGAPPAAEPSTASESPTASDTPAASAGTAGPIETADPGALEQAQASESNLSWGVILMIAVLIALAIVLAVGARRRLRQGNNDVV